MNSDDTIAARRFDVPLPIAPYQFRRLRFNFSHGPYIYLDGRYGVSVSLVTNRGEIRQEYKKGELKSLFHEVTEENDFDHTEKDVVVI